MTNRTHLVALMCSSALLLPAAAFGQTNQQSDQPCDVLVSYLEENQGHEFPVTLEEAHELRADQKHQECRTSIERINATLEQPQQQEQQAQTDGQRQEGGQIVVEQQAPSVTVHAAAPEVTVQQPQPQVTVSQGQPEIVVRQPAPTITIDIPQPEITVRMPEPDVRVSQAQPQVQVEQQQPEVTVRQPEEPQVEVQSAEANVMLQQREQQANVQIEQTGEPNVRYEREEPRVQINQAEGQPTVRFEQASRDDEQMPGEERESMQEQAATQQGEQPDEQELAAQQQGEQPDELQVAAQQEQEVSADTGSASSAQEFVEKAAISNRFELESSNLAVEKAQSAEVQDFAQRMIDDHTNAGEELQQAVESAEADIQVPDTLDQQHQEMLDRLQSAEEAEFEQQYVEMQVQGHERDVQLFSSYAESGDNPELQQFAQNTLPTLEEHLQRIREISQNTGAVAAGEGQQQRQPETQTAQGSGAQPSDQSESGLTGNQQALQGISAEDLLGTTVYGRDDESLGDVGDVILAEDGRVEALIVDVGGFLGIGEKPVAIQIADLNVQQDQNGELVLRINATDEQLEELPEYEEQQ